MSKSRVHEVELEWIPLTDGIRLAARLWLPENSDRAAVPAILEYVPYRRRDSYRERDNYTHAWFAENGYACIRVDVRGTGDSDGVIRDEYLAQEQEDGIEVIDWISRQTWCTGQVGMMGISWGGFNSLQIAARRPAALKAIITACSTDDRYADDMHYMGGCLLNDMVDWGTDFFVRMARSPDPLMVGADRWRQMWRERLEGWTPPLVTWLDHQGRDDYWRQGSVCESYHDIECAVFVVGGWADGYSNAIFRLLENLSCPRIALVGPWGHEYPHRASPGPQIGFLQESKRWWDQWLKGMDTGIMQEPMLRAWIQDSVPPAASYDARPGRWVGEPAWPSPRVRQVGYDLSRGALSLADQPEPAWAAAGAGAPLDICSPQHVGQHGGHWCFESEGDLPIDQREDDGGSLVFDSPPLAEELTILGAAEVVLDLEVDRPSALLAVRLNEVAEDGSDLRITYGVLNLTHVHGHESPRLVVPGERQRVLIRLNETGHAIPAGHRLRLAISTAYWPIVWPSPQPVRLSVRSRGCRLSLPVHDGPKADEGIRFEPAVLGRPTPFTMIRASSMSKVVSRDLMTGDVVHTEIDDWGRMLLHEIGTEVEVFKESTMRIRPNDPTSARAEKRELWAHRRGTDWDISAEARCTLSCTETEFLVDTTLNVLDAGKPFFLKSWLQRVPRRGV
jgi:uncharacterized protein